jgi:Carboxypeptidase regulatory-like domain
MKVNLRFVWRLELILPLVMLAPFARAGVETIEIAKVQVVGQLSGEARDPSGALLPGVTVEEVSPDWKNVLQSAKTNSDGHFALTPLTKKKLYYVVLSLPGFNPTRVRVRIDSGSTKQLNIKLVLST